MADPHPCRLYLISPPRIQLGEFVKQLETAVTSGDVAAFQLRLKEVDDATIIAAAKTLLPICRAQGVAFILNDRPDLAADLKLDGLHLGQDDMNITEARKIVGNEMIIGVSCHDSGHLAMEAGEAGADYVAFGAFYPTTSKSAEKLAQYGTPTIDLLQWWATYTVVPSVAIGGMTPDNCGAQVAAGADFIAAINAIWNHPDGVRAAVKAFNKAIKKGTQARPPI